MHMNTKYIFIELLLPRHMPKHGTFDPVLWDVRCLPLCMVGMLDVCHSVVEMTLMSATLL